MRELDKHLQRFLHPVCSVITGFNRESGFTFYQGVYLFMYLDYIGQTIHVISQKMRHG